MSSIERRHISESKVVRYEGAAFAVSVANHENAYRSVGKNGVAESVELAIVDVRDSNQPRGYARVYDVLGWVPVASVPGIVKAVCSASADESVGAVFRKAAEMARN